MATLRNHTDGDLFCAALHLMVPARGEVAIPDEDADKVNTITGQFTVEKPRAERIVARRGGKHSEQSGAPAMETR